MRKPGEPFTLSAAILKKLTKRHQDWLPRNSMKTIKDRQELCISGAYFNQARNCCRVKYDCAGKTVHESLQWDDSKFPLSDKCPDQINMDCRSNKQNETQEESSD